MFHFVTVVKMESKKKQVENEKLQVLLAWVTDRIRRGEVPRFSDAVEYARQTGLGLSRRSIVQSLRLHPAYLMDSRQARKHNRSGKSRPIISRSLGSLHGDLGFYTAKQDHDVPKTFRAGFLVCRDLLSKELYVEILQGDRTAPTMINALSKIFARFAADHGGSRVTSLAFDQERSVMGHQVQKFLKDNDVVFRAFSNSSSKSKMAENAIRLIREEVQRIKDSQLQKEVRWWHLIQPAVDSLNAKPIVVNGKLLPFAPRDVQTHNSAELIRLIQKADPFHYFTQFEIDTSLLKFKFKIGDIVRAKLITTLSAVLGIKRSEVTLEKIPFVVEKLLAFVTRDWTTENLYLCKSLLDSTFKEVFDEGDLALSRE